MNEGVLLDLLGGGGADFSVLSIVLRCNNNA